MRGKAYNWVLRLTRKNQYGPIDLMKSTWAYACQVGWVSPSLTGKNSDKAAYPETIIT